LQVIHLSSYIHVWGKNVHSDKEREAGNERVVVLLKDDEATLSSVCSAAVEEFRTIKKDSEIYLNNNRLSVVFAGRRRQPSLQKKCITHVGAFITP
jgi:hypothetical protein